MVQLKSFGGLALAVALVMGANNAEAGHHHRHHHSCGSYGSCGSSGGSYGSWGSCGSSGGSWESRFQRLERIEWLPAIRFLWLIGLVRWCTGNGVEQRGARHGGRAIRQRPSHVERSR